MELAMTSPDHGNGRKSLSREIRPDFINQGPPSAQDMRSDFAVPVAIHDRRNSSGTTTNCRSQLCAVGKQLAASGDLYRNVGLRQRVGVGLHQSARTRGEHHQRC